MIYNDPIYGEVEINEPVILELIQSPTLQRLKGIDQAWYFSPHFPGSQHTRFEHSIGVYLLLKKHGTSLEEQIAGLLHDVSHGTFSHCLDYVFEEGSQKEQNHQDNIFEAFIKKTEIPDILKTYGLDIDYIIDDDHFPLKETILPDLCADRIDYSLRTFFHFDKHPVDDILSHLQVQNTTWYFDTFSSAKKFAEMFKRINDAYFSSIESAIMFQTVADTCRYAWKKWYLHQDDFYTTDALVVQKIKNHLDDKQLSLYRKRMNNELWCKNSPDDFDAHIFCKNRLVDPLFMDNGVMRRVSDVDTGWKWIMETEASPKEYFLKFEVEYLSENAIEQDKST